MTSFSLFLYIYSYWYCFLSILSICHLMHTDIVLLHRWPRQIEFNRSLSLFSLTISLLCIKKFLASIFGVRQSTVKMMIVCVLIMHLPYEKRGGRKRMARGECMSCMPPISIDMIYIVWINATENQIECTKLINDPRHLFDVAARIEILSISLFPLNKIYAFCIEWKSGAFLILRVFECYSERWSSFFQRKKQIHSTCLKLFTRFCSFENKISEKKSLSTNS